MAHSPRPTLPPLCTLHLPRGDLHDLDDLKRRPSTSPYRHQLADSPRTPTSPVPCLHSRTNTPAVQTPLFPPRKVRLVPTSLENADAVVLVPPPPAPNAPQPQSQPQPLLLVGPALAQIRHPQRPLAKGARIHPYRVLGPSDLCVSPGRPTQTP